VLGHSIFSVAELRNHNYYSLVSQIAGALSFTTFVYTQPYTTTRAAATPAFLCARRCPHTFTFAFTSQGGYYTSFSQFDAFGMASIADNVYAIPAFRAQYRHARCNLPPRTTVRCVYVCVRTWVFVSVYLRVSILIMEKMFTINSGCEKHNNYRRGSQAAIHQPWWPHVPGYIKARCI